jgi:RimJ/RimL family protein N-acetyltransferase
MAPGRDYQHIEINTRRIVLRSFSATDASEVFACITPAITRFMSWTAPASLADFAAVWRSWLLSGHADSDFHFVARSRAEGRFLGLIGVHQARTVRPELGLWLREDGHQQGYGREALAAVMQWAAHHLRPEGFEYPVAEKNRASRKLAETLGGVLYNQRPGPKYTAVVYHLPLPGHSLFNPAETNDNERY